MKFMAYVIDPASLTNEVIVVDEFNVIKPIVMTAGPDIGMCYLDEPLVNKMRETDLAKELPPDAVLKELDTDVIFAPPTVPVAPV